MLFQAKTNGDRFSDGIIPKMECNIIGESVELSIKASNATVIELPSGDYTFLGGGTNLDFGFSKTGVPHFKKSLLKTQKPPAKNPHDGDVFVCMT